jgi:hypothetical protein
MVKKTGNSRIHPNRLCCGGYGMGRVIYGRYSGSSADGNAGGSSCMCWSGVSTAGYAQSESEAAEADNFHRS